MSDKRLPGDRAHNLSVLLLEDDDADAYLTRRVLMQLPRVGQVTRVRNGQEAIDQLRSGHLTPDIAFVDLQMPKMNGLDFLSTCMNQGLANVPLIVLTSSSDWKDAMRSRVQGALMVITKPEDPAQLKRALQETLDTFTPDDSAREGSQAMAERDLTGAASGVAQFGRRQTPPAL